MLQFTSQEMAVIRQNASLEIIEQIIQDNQVVLTSDTRAT